ncbi:DedA family protein [Vibrio mangrovi]|nr:VTT domain-containing protein [Vibrio mangrovi]MDW6004751.1 VTT domain-containing protein [Vibrio mangrovi]
MIVGIILLSYLLEDAAIVTAASLAAQEQLSMLAALIAIMIGIITGDLGLYYLGRYARTSRWLRYKTLRHRSFKTVRSRLRRGAFYQLFVIRFIPGLRTVGFTLSGFFSLNLSLFLSAVTFATAIWTALVFTVVYLLGSNVWSQAAQYQWVLIPVATTALFLINRFVRHSYTRGLL